MKNNLIIFFKSILIGASALIPGVSGGTMAIALGLYARLLRSVSRFFENAKNNALFLTVFIAGSLVGIFSLSGAVLWLFENYRLPVIYFFIGCVLGSIPMLFRQGGTKTIKSADVLWVLAGYLAVMSVSGMSGASCVIDSGYFAQFLILAGAGAVIAIAFILPGISTSYMLLLLGIYDSTLNALQSGNISFLTPIALGALIGTLITARILENALKRYTKATYMLIIGFVLGSVFEIIPSFPSGINLLICPLTLASGFVAIKLILRFSEEK